MRASLSRNYCFLYRDLHNHKRSLHSTVTTEMVRTRSSQASEPLARMETPPKQPRKAKPKKIVEAVPETPELVQAEPMDHASSPMFKDIPLPVPEVSKILTPPVEQAAAETTSTKRRHDEEEADNASPSKRARTQPTPMASDETYLAMFPKKRTAEESLNLTPRLTDSMRRRKAPLNGRYGSLTRPRQHLPVKLDGDNPFGIETFTQEELEEQAAAHKPKEKKPERERAQQQSAAPAAETPRRGLFGSLRDVGSATLGRVLSPLKKNETSNTNATAPQPRTEPQKRIRAWEIEYPQIPDQSENAPPQEEEQEENESDRKRREYEAKHGATRRAYDHLHTVPADSNPESIRYPVKPKSEGDQPSVDPERMKAAREKRERKYRLKGMKVPTAKPAPSRAPLFGPDSHYARGTKDPFLNQFSHKPQSEHPAMKMFGNASGKRKLEQALPEEAAESQQPRARNSFQPSVEDDDEDMEDEADAPATPLAKKQRVEPTQTPRSALKGKGSVGKGGISARFNDNPVHSIKTISPGFAPAGQLSPDNLFVPKNLGSPASSDGMTPSPNTFKNTINNSGDESARSRLLKLAKQHPGDQLTEALNDKKPFQKVEFMWRDEHDPDWRPSLGNPRPGCFRLLDEDEEEMELDALKELEMEYTSASPEPQPEAPPTPRMSHAELPRAGSPADSTTPFEAANLERRRLDATKTKPKKPSRLAEATSARSRSPSPPGLDTDTGDVSDSSAKTPSPTLDPATNIWTWSPETNEYISSIPNYPDFAYNPENELTPSFAIKSSSGSWDNKVVGPDGMTEQQRQDHYKKKYDDTWAESTFKFDAPQTYEEAGVGSKYIHDLIRKNDERVPDVVRKCDERFAVEWEAHQKAIDDAMKEGKILKATYPDRDGIDMLDEEL